MGDLLENMVPSYAIDWEYIYNFESYVAYWKNKGEVDLTSEKLDEISDMTMQEAKNTSHYYIKRLWLYRYINLNLFEHKADNPPLIISRRNILEESYNQFMTTSELNLKKPIQIYFIDEMANDAGGVYREWYTCLFHEFFNENNKMFKMNKSNAIWKGTFLLHEPIKGKDLKVYEFFGRLLAKAIIDKANINENLNLTLIKRILNQKCDLGDIIFYDIDLENSLKSINELKDNNALGDFFFVWEERDENDQIHEVELIPNGKNIKITNENKGYFIERVIDYITYEKFKEQIDLIRKGLNSLIPEKVLNIFNSEEFAFLITGQQKIDLNDWKKNTLYKGKYESGLKHPIVKMFWEILGEMDNSQLVGFYQFCTGTTRVPVDGFVSLKGFGNKLQKFSIEDLHVDHISKNVNNQNTKEIRLIEAKTCFNRIYIPEYNSKSEMKKAIDIILQSDTNFFGLE